MQHISPLRLGRQWLLAVAAAGCIFMIPATVDARTATPIGSNATAPGEAFGPLLSQRLYAGEFAGPITEHWVYFWQTGAASGPIFHFRSTCEASVEFHSTLDDRLAPASLLSETTIGPVFTRIDRAPDTPVARRVLIRIVRSDQRTEACQWQVDPLLLGKRAIVTQEPTVQILRVERRPTGQPVALTVRVRVLPWAVDVAVRPYVIRITGAITREVRGNVSTSGILTHRIPLSAGTHGRVRVQIELPATPRHTWAISPARVVAFTRPNPRPATQPRSRPAVSPVPRGPLTRVTASTFALLLGRPQVRPRAIFLADSACSNFFTGIRWISWGSLVADGRAMLHRPQPVPGSSCSEAWDNREIVPARVRLTNPRACRGVRLFTRITWSHGGRSHRFDVAGCPRH